MYNPLSQKLWAKKEPKKSLLDHMLETGIVSECLMNGIYNPLLRRLSELTGIEQETLKHKIMFICAMHDIGKAHPVFQGRDTETYDMLCGYNMQQETALPRFRHEQFAEDVVKKLLKHDAEAKSRRMIRTIISMHHQSERPRKHDYVEIRNDIAERWNEIHLYIYHFIKNIFPYQDLNIEPIDKSHMFVVENGILGILITSDWIASCSRALDNASYTEFSDMDAYIDYKKNQAAAFFSEQGLITQKFPEPKLFNDMFRFSNIHPVQADVENIVNSHHVQVMLIESGCGSGKTEAALYAASVIGYQNGLTGIYMGLPTGTSAEAIQGRIDDCLTGLGMNKTKLFTSKSILLRESGAEPEFTDVSRQRLLAPSAVGTVDQVMTAARRVRFESVRMAGLSSKVLIIDELHAYDMYMLTTIERLLQMCCEAGIPVIMLSATLPISTKKILFSAVTENVELHNGYPMITYLDECGLHEHVSKTGGQDKDVVCDILTYLTDAERIADIAVTNITNGGCECVIVNTVSDAIAVYDAIKCIMDSDCEILLYHARMPENTRKEKVKKILKKLGKDRLRPYKMIVVGTQVLEQSIDIDVDYMITAICPIDLLLQRIGRYHRHDDAGTIREHADIGNHLQVLIPPDGDYKGTGAVYETVFLDATVQLIQQHTLSIPSCTPEVVNAVYACPNVRIQAKRTIAAAASDNGNINVYSGFHLYDDCVNGWLSDRYINVRDADASVQVAVMPSETNHAVQDRQMQYDIDMYRQYVVTVRRNLVAAFLQYGQKGNGLFRDVVIFDEDNGFIALDDEYGLKIVKEK